MIIYLTLFFSSLGAATFLPVVSEAVLLYDLSLGYHPFWLWLVATIGNALGSVINYVIGLKGESFLESKGYLPKEKMEYARRLFHKYGGWTLLLSWAPVIGDPLTMVAGIMRYPFWNFLLIVAFSKGVRYAVLIYTWKQFG